MSETFEVGQKVEHNVRGEVEVSYGPFTDTFGRRHYVVRLESGREQDVTALQLSAIPETPKFSVGDVVTLTTRRGAKATVEYGPFDDRDVYLVKLVDEPADEDEVRTFTALASVMRADEPIKVGDKVRVTDDDGGGACRFNGLVGTVMTVHPSYDRLRYLVEFGDGRGHHGDLNGRWNCAAVERVDDGVKVGDRVRVIAASFASETHGKVGTVEEADSTEKFDGIPHPFLVRFGRPSDTVYASKVERIDGDTHTYNGVTYDLTAQYKDCDGDVWRLGRVAGAVRGRMAHLMQAPIESSRTLNSIIDSYGPLTRV
ncbi:phiSA1p31-related protein [Streptomyces sp. NPDC004528]|uniref:phiSA1p31-related protein n=1 Tax=Streptomyces sp. NPDC004528 TaxID=3154550 RepID=UPI0033B8CB61